MVQVQWLSEVGHSAVPFLLGAVLASCFGVYGFVKANYGPKKYLDIVSDKPKLEKATTNVTTETEFFVHNGMDSRYWYFGGIAYNVTDFVDAHPGGHLAITHGKGRECKTLVMSYHLDVPKVMKYIKNYKVSPEIRCELFKPFEKFTFEEDGFFMDCKNAALEFFSSRNLSWKAPTTWVMWQTFIILLSPTLYGIVCYFPSLGLKFWHAALLMVAFGYTRAMIIMQTTHAVSHFAMFKNPFWNRMYYQVTIILSSVWLSQSWDVQHVIGHHIFTNQWPYDSDSGFPARSLTHEQKRFWYHKYQHLYAWGLYATLCPSVFLNAVREQFYGKQNAFIFRYHNWGQRCELPFELICIPLYFFALFFFHGWRTATILTLIGAVTTSLDFTLQFVVNHELDGIMNDEAAQRPYIKDPKQKVDFGQFQVEESNTVNGHSGIFTELAGGLNTQIEHHIFPNVHYSWYTTLALIIQDKAKKHGVKYKASSWTEALCSHYRLLKTPPKSIRGKQ